MPVLGGLHPTPLHRPGCSARSCLNSWVLPAAPPSAAQAQGKGSRLLVAEAPPGRLLLGDLVCVLPPRC